MYLKVVITESKQKYLWYWPTGDESPDCLRKIYCTSPALLKYCTGMFMRKKILQTKNAYLS